MREPARDLLGKPIGGGKYLVRSLLGQGGMGTVFEAEHTEMGRMVAVKVLHPSRARKKDAIRRFHLEARAAAAIGHPNICEVYDFGSLDDGSPFLVMERLVGETLAERIAVEGGLPFESVIDVLVQILSALAAAHSKRIVHRDVKPENVFLSKRPDLPPLVKLLDFGISKMTGPVGGQQDELDLTRTGMVMGTPYYLSPEQARGDRDLDTRVDLYACGVILYEALTGRRPFVAANYNALLLQILSATPRPARELRPALPGGFDTVIDRAIARDREQRYRIAADFEGALNALRDRHGTPGVGLSAVGPPAPRSIEIPVTFAVDTPGSGEHPAVDPAAHGVGRLVPHLDDEDPTVRMNNPFAHEAADGGGTEPPNETVTQGTPTRTTGVPKPPQRP
jgi:serine/threonine protein kinase